MDQVGWDKEIFDSAPSLCVVMNAEGIIIDCNHSFFKALGYRVGDELVGRSIFEYAIETDKETLRKSFEIWKKTGKVHNYEFKMKRADGSTFPALVNATSIHDEFGRVIACNAVILNITELINARKKIEVAMNDLVQKDRELNETNEELKRVEKAKEEFISMVSHELKNPLTPIIAFSDILKNQIASGKELTEKQLACVPIINENARGMKRLIEDILSVYKLDMHLNFAFSETKIVELVDQVLAELTSILDEKGIKLETTVSLREGKEAVITCDTLRLKQVLNNLIRNSVDFLPTSGGKITIALDELEQRQETSSKTSSLLVSLYDNGAGVPPDKVSSLFKKFYQADLKATRKYGGTGLGLTICKEIVEMHGGKIWYDSEYGKGACFRFTLPRQQVPHS
jgi:PAS domain S-box-containing protein